MLDPKRKIPYNYTSADDHQIIRHLFGSSFLKTIQDLELQKETGRSSRLLHRFMGDLFIIERNPFLFREIIEDPGLKKYLFSQFKNDLDTIERHATRPAVFDLVKSCRKRLSVLIGKICGYRKQRHKLLRHLAPVIGRKNIYFDPFNICSHSTDATDWRLHSPVAVLRPDREDQVPELVTRIKRLGYHLIPRGAGTGLTGGATPTAPNCIILNTEKLNTISDIEYETDQTGRRFASLGLGAGTITQDAIDAADKNGFIFATDPTSAWACTIGGNLSENAGGKKAVLFGTAIDNVLSYTMILPDGSTRTIRRRNHPLTKIKPGEPVRFDVFDRAGKLLESISLSPDRIRKKGLGKDVTNKVLEGLYGIQKEGCDGIITSARFVLYPKFRFDKTICIEFFGNDMRQAGRVIADITNAFSDREPALMALEHFDEEYIKAIRYKTKTSVGSRIIAVLLMDLVSNEKAPLIQGIEKIRALLEPYDKTGFKIAATRKEAARFWQDRKRLGAIAAHTKAFKLNEDIVLPIDSLASFAGWVDQCNIEEKKRNQIHLIDNIIAYLDTARPLADPELLKKRAGQARDLAFQVKKKMEIASRDAIEAYIHAKNFYTSVLKSIRGYTLVTENVTQIYEKTRRSLIVIATHMHAGDGNVHVNIPVFSNDREMMKRAGETADRVMEKAVELNGVVSGEHGIGITKMKHLDAAMVSDFDLYRRKVDPDGLMNPNKLHDPHIIRKVFTPSFNLLEIEARILKHSDLSKLAENVANCVRCGKCKIDCPVFYPAENLFFHPRNKNLAIGSLIEALLYISQRTQSTGFKILKQIGQIADHCTICHKCFAKCPVQIDTGMISISERRLLAQKSFKRINPAVNAVLSYLGTDHPFANGLLRSFLLKPGARLQRAGAKAVSPLNKNGRLKRSSLLRMLKSPVSLPDATSFRRFVPKTDKNQAILIEPEKKAGRTIFYFPGCGSERVFSRIAKASVYLLLKHRTRVILPPSYLCCGFPFLANAKIKRHEKMVLENIIVLSQIRSMFQDLLFDACLVSCGTCMESLADIGIESLYGCPLTDISRFILDINADLELDGDFLYHTPCHDSLESKGVAYLAPRMAGHDLTQTPHCCSEAGTLALSRPDISNAMLRRKQAATNRVSSGERLPVITNCPSCIQGLGRLDSGKRRILHLAEVLAGQVGGHAWEDDFKDLAAKSEVVTF